jgi:hypothetical protein
MDRAEARGLYASKRVKQQISAVSSFLFLIITHSLLLITSGLENFIY